MLDIRQLKEGDTRFSERLLVGKNLFTSLREALEFFSRAIQLEGASLDSLSRTEGSADYIALREGLVNQFIHQDYTSSQAAAQIDLRPRRAILFNPGHSLVPTRQLPDGGRSQARNPLIARAFRLVGFAELGGSGLTSLQRVWRIARRRPPRFESSPESNSFSLTLSWEPLAPDVDVAWQKRLGAVLSAREASALNLVLSAGALSLQEIASGTELDVETVEAIVTRLKVQRLLELDDGEKVRASESAQEAWSRGQD